MVAIFQVGTQSTVSVPGILFTVGNDYIILYQPNKDRYVMGDLYALKFGDALAELTGGRLREGREVRWGHPGGTYFDGLLPYTYDGKHCFLLWDDRRKWKKIGAQNPFWHDNWGNEPAIYDFTYSLRGAQQLVLCRWREECYVLLLLTRPMFLPGE